MSGKQNSHLPVPTTVSGGEGFIWDADGTIDLPQIIRLRGFSDCHAYASAGVKWLRQHCRIVGGMTGSTEQKQHKAAGGLPCKLSAEELDLAVHQGWVTIVETLTHPEGADTSSAAVSLQAPAWLTAVLTKKPVRLPVQRNAQSSSAPSRHAGLEATYPPGTGVLTETGTDTRNMSSSRKAVFFSLHASGYYVTDGSKFGSDYLLYPGDPLLYHAQFTVQVLDYQAAIKPALLVGSARGSHSARKHLLLASAGSSGISYITVAPEGGFGSTG